MHAAKLGMLLIFQVLYLPKDYYIEYRWTEHSTYFFEKMTTGGGKKASQITQRGGIFWTISFVVLKNSNQEGSNTAIF